MVSIIIVNYHVKKELFSCLQSIYKSLPRTTFEIIVVDNDEEKYIEKELHEKFSRVRYVPNNNNGFGEGNNVGARYANGELLFFLNPDTILLNNAMDSLVKFLGKNKEAAIVAPLLYDPQKRPYPLQGVSELNPLRAIFVLSFLTSIFKENTIYKEYYLYEWDKKSNKMVDAVPGTAFMIRKKIFKQIDGFDESFFLYFEEFDLCKRVKQSGYNIYITPDAKVMHHWGKSTDKSNKNIQKIFQQSRFYYFRKHYGLVSALITEGILRINKYSLALVTILVGSLLIMTYRLGDLMPFIGDQGWFYLSASDMMTQGTIPLVGIASSHPWLHQGALWTYMLAGALALGQFHPLSGAYLTIILGLITIWMMYWVGSNLFSRRVGLTASLFFATSPLVIIHMRMPYHTTPIPLFTLLYIYLLYQWLQGKPQYLPLIIFTLAVLYNFQVSTFLLTIVFLIIVAFGFWKKKVWLFKSLTPKMILLSIASFVVPMTPMLIYDFGHGFPQTVLFIAWLGYKVATVFGYPSLRPDIPSTDIKTVIVFLAEYYKRLIYLPSNLVALTIAFFSFGFFFQSLTQNLRSKKHHTGEYLLGLLVVISILGIIVTKTASEAYLPILFPTIILVTALFFDKLISIKPTLKPVVVLIVGLIAFMNATTLVSNNYLVGKGGGLANQIRAAKEIIIESDGREYNLIGKGEGSNFESFTMNYEYLAWWLGHGPSKEKQQLKIIIEETQGGIKVTKKDK